ncbi:MAG: hypothetical protein M9950_11230 [Thermomicrobiales bacterium]|nr:hypothetical protein [Thermomicrobiales bacterium]
MPSPHDSEPMMINLATISTPREKALVALEGPIDPELIASATEAHFHSLPLVADDGRCLGTISVQELARLAANRTPLTTEHATSPCARLPYLVPIGTLVQSLLDPGIIIHTADPDADLPVTWFGIITPADLNKPIFRAHVYMMLVTLETSLGQLIMDEFGDDWGAIRLLSENTQRRVKEFWDEERAEGVDLSPITTVTLSDLFHIAIESHRVWSLMGFDSPATLRPIAQHVNDLRNRIMHPVRPLIVNQQELRELADGIHSIETLTHALEKRIGVLSG